MIYPWLTTISDELSRRQQAGQLAHALLIHGPAGTGRHQLAYWLASQMLGMPESPVTTVQGRLVADSVPAHADLVTVQAPEDKRVIPIDQVRDMIGFLQLTAHQGGHKIAVVSPAEALSHQAANSLLKTLEEPPAGSLIMLIAEIPGRLAATIVSRCQRIRVPLPASAKARAWLEQESPGPDWNTALRLAGGAPLLALELQRQGFLDEAARMEADLVSLSAGEVSPASVARRWGKLAAGQCLDWLYRRASLDIRTRLTGDVNSGTAHLQIVDDPLNIEPLFTYLRELGELRRLLGAGLNMDLNLAYLLDAWYGRGSARLPAARR